MATGDPFCPTHGHAPCRCLADRFEHMFAPMPPRALFGQCEPTFAPDPRVAWRLIAHRGVERVAWSFGGAEHVLTREEVARLLSELQGALEALGPSTDPESEALRRRPDQEPR